MKKSLFRFLALLLHISKGKHSGCERCKHHVYYIVWGLGCAPVFTLCQERCCNVSDKPAQEILTSSRDNVGIFNRVTAILIYVKEVAMTSDTVRENDENNGRS